MTCLISLCVLCVQVLMTDGDDELGGDDLTRALCDHLLQLAGSR